MSLGRIGLVGELKRATRANMIFWMGENNAGGQTGVRKMELAGRSSGINDDRTNCIMPYSGKFLQMILRLKAIAWRGTITLQKNDVDTALTITIDPSDLILHKITETVSFVAGDKFRLNVNTIAIGTPNRSTLTVIGGLDVP